VFQASFRQGIDRRCGGPSFSTETESTGNESGGFGGSQRPTTSPGDSDHRPSGVSEAGQWPESCDQHAGGHERTEQPPDRGDLSDEQRHKPDSEPGECAEAIAKVADSQPEQLPGPERASEHLPGSDGGGE
jgi:hypothetical protein